MDKTRIVREAVDTSTGQEMRHFAHYFPNGPFTLAEQLPIDGGDDGEPAGPGTSIIALAAPRRGRTSTMDP